MTEQSYVLISFTVTIESSSSLSKWMSNYVGLICACIQVHPWEEESAKRERCRLIVSLFTRTCKEMNQSRLIAQSVWPTHLNVALGTRGEGACSQKDHSTLSRRITLLWHKWWLVRLLTHFHRTGTACTAHHSRTIAHSQLNSWDTHP